MSYRVDFCDISPDLVEQRTVETGEWRCLDIPADAMMFSFFRDGQYVGPTGYVTEDEDVGTVGEMIARHPAVAVHSSATAAALGYESVALVTWSKPKYPRRDGRMLVPLIDGVVVVRRRDGSAVWPNDVRDGTEGGGHP